MTMARKIDAGCVWINCHIPVAAEMPHSGFQHSGYGKDRTRRPTVTEGRRFHPSAMSPMAKAAQARPAV